ncbi:cryptochrome/photolyase family protein [Alkalibacterium kapii]|uniref:Deoxyribodipyrimidine photo-lyase n=1 Tax=Alkalibacterium kapii TaxID=426704 RepID=A0A511AUH3_9LACT|nr:deoxyribodipyrimidine photo-lyase [Alkalibacterium kapii]GEK91784.1 deoxyribodipyrimidine photo-lyase [Alkalibacterium kapii]
MVAVMWFRRDLRLEDNTALKQALLESDKLILLFHVNPAQFLDENSLNMSAFFNSVETFRKKVAEEGATLQIVYGELEEVFKKLKEKVPDWSDIYVNRDESGFGLERDKKAGEMFQELDVSAHGFHDHYIHSAQEIKTNAGTPYKVFTPYYNKWKERPKPGIIETDFSSKTCLKDKLFPEDMNKFQELLDDLALLPDLELGTDKAQERLDEFIENDLAQYEEARDFPLKDATSRLSKHLRTGELSIRTVYNKVMDANQTKGRSTFIQELAWRDFYNMIYASHPDQKDVAIKKAFTKVEWDNNEENFKAWKEGKTGFPIVDAAMRQLNGTGWMHNRLRMITASFLTKDLLIDWRWGERYFQEKLIDYDSASNIGGWQWAASTGTDGVPYFRIFNPTTQSERFDKKGDFIRKFVPELNHVQGKKIHQPEKLTEKEQKEYNVIIGKDYPNPIVSHKNKRKLAIKAFEKSKKVMEE